MLDSIRRHFWWNINRMLEADEDLGLGLRDEILSLEPADVGPLASMIQAASLRVSASAPERYAFRPYRALAADPWPPRMDVLKALHAFELKLAEHPELLDAIPELKGKRDSDADWQRRFQEAWEAPEEERQEAILDVVRQRPGPVVPLSMQYRDRPRVTPDRLSASGRKVYERVQSLLTKLREEERAPFLPDGRPRDWSAETVKAVTRLYAAAGTMWPDEEVPAGTPRIVFAVDLDPPDPFYGGDAKATGPAGATILLFDAWLLADGAVCPVGASPKSELAARDFLARVIPDRGWQCACWCSAFGVDAKHMAKAAGIELPYEQDERLNEIPGHPRPLGASMPHFSLVYPVSVVQEQLEPPPPGDLRSLYCFEGPRPWPLSSLPERGARRLRFPRRRQRPDVPTGDPAWDEVYKWQADARSGRPVDALPEACTLSVCSQPWPWHLRNVAIVSALPVADLLPDLRAAASGVGAELHHVTLTDLDTADWIARERELRI
jgi:hypothetical protein